MREIKFRAWIKSGFDYDIKPFMVEVASIDFNNFGQSIKTPEDDEEWSKEDYVLMQFTGLLDKNGIEIYEGDIVCVTGDEFYSNNSVALDVINGNWHFKGKVESNSFMWLILDESRDWIPFCDILSNDIDVEVIGNIYQNPELIEEVE